MLIYLIIINIISFILMIFDKKQAIRKKYRIPETSLIIISFLGGSIGTLLGMIIAHHKTRKPKFIILIPISILITILIIIK